MKHDPTDFKYFTAPDLDLNTWMEKYGLEVKESPCLQCKMIRKTTVPAFGKTWRGLVAPTCECGFDGPFQYYILTPDADPGEFIKGLSSGKHYFSKTETSEI